MGKLRISSSLNLHHYPKDDVSEYIRQGLVFHKKVGFDAADFPMRLIDFLDANWKYYIEKAAEDTVETGIKFEICHLPFGVTICPNSADLSAFNEKMHNAIDAAAMLGVDYAVLHPNTTTISMSEFDRKEQYDSVIKHLAPFAEHAAKVNLKIAVENMRLVNNHIPSHRYCQEPDELCDIADALGMDICWDFGHANTCGFNQYEALSYVGARLKVLHVNDNNGVGDDHIPPFCGTINWKDAMKGLASIGFNGHFNYEIVAKNVPESLRESFARYLIECATALMTH